MKNRWTWHQYRIIQVFIGIYYLFCFIIILPRYAWYSSAGFLPDKTICAPMYVFPNLFWLDDSPAMFLAVFLIGALSAALLVVGSGQRIAAILLWYIWACFYGRHPIGGTSLIEPFLGFLLLVCAFVPRLEDDLRWELPPPIFLVSWVVVGLAYSYSGYTKLMSSTWISGDALLYDLDTVLARSGSFKDLVAQAPPWVWMAATWAALGAELLFLPLSIFRRPRIVIWALLLLMHLLVLCLFDILDISIAMVIVHLYLMDPGWIAPARSGDPEIIFYDASSEYSRWMIRFVVTEGRDAHFRFAPIDGATFRREVLAAGQRARPASGFVLAADGTIRSRGDALLHVGDALGGFWRLFALISRRLPRPVVDGGLALFLRAARRFISRTADGVPLVPEALRSRLCP